MTQEVATPPSAPVHRYEPVRVALAEIAAARKGCVPQDRIEKLCAALIPQLQALHAGGQVYGALSPTTVLLDERGKATLAPAPGPARPAADAGTALLAGGYAAFEQYTDDPDWPCGPWTDVYGLSALLHALIVGAPPPRALRRCINDNYAPLAGRSPPGYGDALLRAVDAGLAREPAARPQDMAAFAALLGIDLTRAPHPEPVLPVPPAPPAEPAAPPAAARPGRRPLAIAAACLLAVAAAWWGWRHADRAPSSGPSGAPATAAAAGAGANGGTAGAGQAGGEGMGGPANPGASGALGVSGSSGSSGGTGGPGGTAGTAPRSGQAQADSLPQDGQAASGASPSSTQADRGGAAGAGAAADATPDPDASAQPRSGDSRGAASTAGAAAAPVAGAGPAGPAAGPSSPARPGAASPSGASAGAAPSAAGPRPGVAFQSSRPEAARVRVQLDIRPWGQVLVDGEMRALSPPAKSLMLAPGSYRIEVRNGSLPPYRATLDVRAGQPAAIRHDFD